LRTLITLPSAPTTAFLPYTTLFRSQDQGRVPARTPGGGAGADLRRDSVSGTGDADCPGAGRLHARRRRSAAAGHGQEKARGNGQDRKSTRLNSSHVSISYAVFCLKK